MTPRTIIEVLDSHVARKPNATAFVFLDSNLGESATTTFAQLHHKVLTIAGRLQLRSTAGDRALLLLSEGPGFVNAFLGCIYAGIIAVPCYPPQSRRESSSERLDAVLRDTGARLVITEQPYVEEVGEWLREKGLAAEVESLLLSDLEAPGPAWRSQLFVPEQIAFLQYTSGSTGTPKGVIVNHANILANSQLIKDNLGHREDSVSVSWLPRYHDMGLIGHVFQPLYVGCIAVLMSPLTFLSQPANWLRAISKYRGTCSGAPNFAYQLCVDRISSEQLEGVDLSSWEMAYVGAELVRAKTLREFGRKFSACGFRSNYLYPCYGLAEATLFVSGPLKQTEPQVLAVDRKALTVGKVEVYDKRNVDVAVDDRTERVHHIVSSGSIQTGQQIAVVDPNTHVRCKPREVGEVWIRHGSVATGYWQRPAESQQTFDARIAGEGNDAFLRTGDVGFIHDEQLFVTGRIKEVIIIRGRKYSPTDIEYTAQQVDETLRMGGGAAFSIEIDETEKLVLVQELTRAGMRSRATSETSQRIRQAVGETHLLQIHDIVLIRPNSLPRTSSGKIRRMFARELYLTGKLETVNRSPIGFAIEVQTQVRNFVTPRNEVERELAKILKELLRADASMEDRFFELGGDSLIAAQVLARLQARFDVVMNVEEFLSEPTLRAAADRIVELQKIGLIASGIGDAGTDAARRVGEI